MQQCHISRPVGNSQVDLKADSRGWHARHIAAFVKLAAHGVAKQSQRQDVIHLIRGIKLHASEARIDLLILAYREPVYFHAGSQLADVVREIVMEEGQGGPEFIVVEINREIGVEGLFFRKIDRTNFTCAGCKVNDTILEIAHTKVGIQLFD